MREQVIVKDEHCRGEDEIYTELYDCPNCDKTIISDSNYCSGCGYKIVWQILPIINPSTVLSNMKIKYTYLKKYEVFEVYLDNSEISIGLRDTEEEARQLAYSCHQELSIKF